MKWQRDLGLTMRVWLTMFLLFIIYLVFISILSALGVGLGWLVIISVGLAFIQYFFSDKLVLMSTQARVVDADEYPELHQMVSRLCATADLPMPRIAIMPSPVPNAFATGRSPRHAVVAVTDSIYQLLTPKELEAVLAHELSHVKNRDMLTLTIASFIGMIASIIMQNGIFMSLGDRREGNPWLIAWIVAIIVWVISTILIRTLSRYREFAADRGSALITQDPQSLISALEKISGRISRASPEKQREIEGANAFFILPVLSTSTLQQLFSTHPPLEKRIAALEAIEDELKGY
jgi:heat shock protein HtpX